MNSPLVSICCVTYNHVEFIKRCIDGFLMQKTNFQYEILIHDDCSTDGTREIIEDYAAKYPLTIFPIFEEENQYSKGVWVDGYNYCRAKGKYIAYCEGDDFWIDSMKLQKQVDFMKAHPNCTVCFTDYNNYNINTQKFEKTPVTEYCKKHNVFQNGFVVLPLKDFFATWLTMPLTMVFRKDSYDVTWWRHFRYYRDQHEIYLLMKQGECYILNAVTAQRNMHDGGVASLLSAQQKCVIGLSIAEELYLWDKQQETRFFYEKILQWAIYESKNFGFNRKELSWKLFKLNHSIIRYLKNISL